MKAKFFKLSIRTLAIALSSFMLVNYSFSQGTAINNTGASADNSAILDISSTKQGILVPRMTESEKNTIASPATGLMIYQTDNAAGFWYFNGAIWIRVSGVAGATGNTGATGQTGITGATGPVGCSTSNSVIKSNGTSAVCSQITDNGSSVGVNNTSPDASALLDLTSTTKGTAITRMTIAQRNAIVSPVEGLLVYNLDCHNFSYNAGTPASPNWIDLNAPILPSAPTAGTHVGGQYQIVWNWNSVAGATGYKWNTTNNVLTATNNGASTTYTQTGLNCGIPYTLYVWAYNNCGNSNVTVLTQATTGCPFSCGTPVTFTYKGASVTYGTVVHNSECWMDRNLGASQVATASNDALAYGDLFQWGRLDDGHQTRTSGTTSTNSSIDVPGHSNFITEINSPYDWRDPQNDNLWQGSTGTNNPCPSGWRIPYMSELSTERASWATQNASGAFGSPLKLTVAGIRGNGGGLVLVGSDGYYWASDVNGVYARNVFFWNGGAADNGGSNRADGFSVRCILN